jgi:YD repeat-containing protein
MKSFTASILLLLLTGACSAQFYYKDLLLSRQSGDQWKLYKKNKIRTVTLASIERDGEPSEGFAVDQEVSSDFSHITTHTHSPGSPETWLIAWYSPAGLPSRTLDTSDTYQSATEYQYDASGHISVITNTSTETDNQLKAVEQHIWNYDASGQPSSMLKIKNGADTTFVRFRKDASGHLAEEDAERNHSPLPTVYYYYDSGGRLTDIVRYNEKAGRLLPDYIFEYGEGDMLQSTLIVQEGGANYQKWIYEYNDKSLKTKESCFNKKREMLGTVTYSYK